eukprot:TRINITY_DN65468_c0_g1_i1.p1 TRINITY_DN65468_c0_g1~~TRINITY_DN65468_c0_g1_i1.p1  ORF type:complete len:305 (+),score=60.54 TRINITY_DN65468_c0_g1_i1:56-970(+)
MCDLSMSFTRMKDQCAKMPRRQRAAFAHGSAGHSERARHEKTQSPYLIDVEDMEESGAPPRRPATSSAKQSKEAAAQSSYLLPLEEMHDSDSPPCETTLAVTKSCKQSATQACIAMSPRAVLLSSIPTAARAKSIARVAADVDTIFGDVLSRPMLDPTIDPSDRFKLPVPEAVTMAADIARQAAVECSNAWGAMLRAKFVDLAGYSVEGDCAEQQVSAGACSSRTSVEGRSVETQELEELVDEVACADVTWLMEPPQGACSWDWPLSRAEAKERVVMFEQFELMSEVQELRTRVSSGMQPRASC